MTIAPSPSSQEPTSRLGTEARFATTFYELTPPYPAGEWELSGDGFALKSAEVPSYQIRELGPTEFPGEIFRSVELGGVVFDVFERTTDSGGRRADWHAAIEGFSSAQPGTTALLIVEARIFLASLPGGSGRAPWNLGFHIK